MFGRQLLLLYVCVQKRKFERKRERKGERGREREKTPRLEHVRGTFGRFERRQAFFSRVLSPPGLCYVNVPGCCKFIVIFHLASDGR